MQVLLNFSSKDSAAVPNMTEMSHRSRFLYFTVYPLVFGLVFSFAWGSSGAQAALPAAASSTNNAPINAPANAPANPPANAPVNMPANTNTPGSALTNAPKVKPVPRSQAWQRLNPKQKEALAPLGAQWGSLTAQQQNKWLAISQNFTQLSVADQVTMHTRMADWVALSPQQRTLARLNFNKLQNLPKEDKKSKWEAYQALSDEEKSAFSNQSTAPQKSAARSAKPQESPRLITTPKGVSADNQRSAPAINRKTLLPKPPAVAVPATPPSSTIQLPGISDTTRPAAENAPS